MSKTSSHFRISKFRNRVLVWTLLAVLSCSFAPSVSIAQQPTATVSALSGDVMVSGQAATDGTVLRAGDMIQTQAGASVVLELSDGSKIELGENTQINIDDLSQTDTGARVSSIKLLAGWLRALLSSEHQQEGSAFTIETPNAQLGVKFSQPDVEVSYDPAKQETIGIARTVALMATNLLTDEEVLVPVGSTVIIVGTTIKIVAGILAIAGSTEAGTTGAGATKAATSGAGTTSTGTSNTGSSGMGTGTKVVIGAGVVAAAGGMAALAVSSGGGDDSGEEGSSVSFTGTFRIEHSAPDNAGWIETYDLIQEGTSVTGTFEVISWRPNPVACPNEDVYFIVYFTGVVNQQGQLIFSVPAEQECCGDNDSYCSRMEAGTYTLTSADGGNALYGSGPDCTLQFDVCQGTNGPYVRQ